MPCSVGISSEALQLSGFCWRKGGIWQVTGRLAQLGEHQLDKLGVTGSSPVPPIENFRATRDIGILQRSGVPGTP
jgi:hypothetical protein